jgi:hypothetical protein
MLDLGIAVERRKPDDERHEDAKDLADQNERSIAYVIGCFA